MRLKHLLETPLPDDWDKEVFTPKTSFKKKIDYALEKAQKIGVGSSRVAFEVEYENRPTILKIAKNKKGLAQNEFEAQMFNDYYIISLNITIPMIDYDKEHEEPIWLHVEKAEKMKPTQFKKFFGVSHFEIEKYIDHIIGRNHYPTLDEKIQNLYEENEYFRNLVELIGNYDLPSADLARLANWGVYNNRPVIVDLGLSNDILNTYYLQK